MIDLKISAIRGVGRQGAGRACLALLAFASPHALLVPALSIFVPGRGVGGDVILDTGPGLATSAMPTPVRDAGMAVASEMDPGATAEIQEALDNGDLELAEIWGPGPVGAHDHNTIAVRKASSPEVVAVALLHEWEHIENCDPGDKGDSRRSDPCYECTHAAMNFNSASALESMICSREYEPHEEAKKKADCAALNEMRKQSYPLVSDTCLLGNCPYDLVPGVAECPNCP